MSQQSRLDYHALAPNAAKALARFSFAASGSLEPRLKELVNLWGYALTPRPHRDHQWRTRAAAVSGRPA